MQTCRKRGRRRPGADQCTPGSTFQRGPLSRSCAERCQGWAMTRPPHPPRPCMDIKEKRTVARDLIAQRCSEFSPPPWLFPCPAPAHAAAGRLTHRPPFSLENAHTAPSRVPFFSMMSFKRHECDTRKMQIFFRCLLAERDASGNCECVHVWPAFPGPERPYLLDRLRGIAAGHAAGARLCLWIFW